MTNLKNDASIEFGKLLAHPEPGQEVVISGLSGTFADSEDVHKLRDNLFNKINLISSDNERWTYSHPEIPKETGKVPNLKTFDAGYFGIHWRQATCMDPQLRLILQKTIEALFDAGINPSDLKDTKTGVFIGVCYAETEKTWFYDNLVSQGFAFTGCARSMLAHRISYFLKLKGPSYVCDTACSSSFYALEHAYVAIRTGQCDRAIVGGANICLHANLKLQFKRLGVLTMHGACKVFDEAADGYVRSEAITVVILQKCKEAKRNYAKTNCDGFKDSGISYPSSDMQVELLKEFYEECDHVKPTDLSYLEAHGTGTKAGDSVELQAIDDFFLKGRTTPLLLGSVKSNIGHTEPASGLCALTKAIIAFETGFIPPNMHYNIPRKDAISLADGRLQVVTEKIPFNDNRGLIGKIHIFIKSSHH